MDPVFPIVAFFIPHGCNSLVGALFTVPAVNES